MYLKRFYHAYGKLLAKRPYLVQALQTGTLMATGDLISQSVVEGKSLEEINFDRTLQFSSIGFFIGGPALHLWYSTLNKYIGSSGKSVVVKKVLVDQALFAPGFLFLLLGTVGAMQGKPITTVKQDLKNNYLDVLKTNYCIWPGVQLLNFYYTPLQYQVLLVQTVALFWNTYISWKTNRQYSNE